jgi:hypothetical protein
MKTKTSGVRAACGECGKRRVLNVELTTTCGDVAFVCEPCAFELVRARTERAERDAKIATADVAWTMTRRSATQPGYRAYTAWSLTIGNVRAVVCDDASYVVATTDCAECVSGRGTSVTNAQAIAIIEARRMSK